MDRSGSAAVVVIAVQHISILRALCNALGFCCGALVPAGRAC
jgi:hypothetical protein